MYRPPVESDFTPMFVSEIQERVIARTKPGGPDNLCWEWSLGVKDNGYGYMSVGRLRWYAHRWAYRAWNGSIPRGMQVCHTCDNRRCANPKHLFLGSHKDNALDAKAKGRLSCGERHSVLVSGDAAGNAKLTWVSVRAVRYLGEKCGLRAPALSKAFNVTPATINGILRQSTWKEPT